MKEAITTRLHQWRTGAQVTHMSEVPTDLAQAIATQDSVGWEQFQFGMISSELMQIQDKHFKSKGKRSTGLHWMSRLLQRIWDLHHSLWQHRNSFLHKGKKCLHELEREAVDKSIRWEFALGKDGLDSQYNRFFSGCLQSIVMKDDISKLHWLHSIWLGRDALRKAEGLEPMPRDPLASAFLYRSRLRKKRKVR